MKLSSAFLIWLTIIVSTTGATNTREMMFEKRQLLKSTWKPYNNTGVSAK